MAKDHVYSVCWPSDSLIDGSIKILAGGYHVRPKRQCRVHWHAHMLSRYRVGNGRLCFESVLSRRVCVPARQDHLANIQFGRLILHYSRA